MTPLRCIGLLGGMSWESTQHYYQKINEGIRNQLGGWYSAPLLLHSFNFAEIKSRQEAGAWDDLAEMLCHKALKLEAAGAQALMICANTMHKVATEVEATLSIPLIHLADVTATALLEAGHHQVGLLGTRYTMSEDFYRKRLEKSGLEVVLPTSEAMLEVDRIIFDELVLGQITDYSRLRYLTIMQEMNARGASAMILGCTEIGLLVKSNDTRLPLFDTLELHVKAALDFMLSTKS